MFSEAISLILMSMFVMKMNASDVHEIQFAFVSVPPFGIDHLV